nr:hypothetical protein [Ampulex compressa]
MSDFSKVMTSIPYGLYLDIRRGHVRYEEIYKMFGAAFGATLLVQFLHLLAGASGQSPCPEYFRYARDKATNEVMGEIQIPAAPTGIALHLRVSLSIATALPSKYVGRLELAQSKQESVRAVQQGRSLAYRLYFPLSRPIPLLTGLWFNERQLCVGRRAMGHIVTTIYLEHTLYPPGVKPLSQNSWPVHDPLDVHDLPSTHILEPPVKPPLHPATPKPKPAPTPVQPLDESPFDEHIFGPDKYNHHPECGRGGSYVNPLIAGGIEAYPGQWPWLVAIFIVRIEFEFQCGGTLLTNRHILTAAHCCKRDSIDVPPSAMLVSLGRYRLRDWKEKGSVNREVAEYRYHPDYEGRANADSDLAIIILRESVQYSRAIKPICLWAGSSDLSNVIGKSGYVVGWGRDELGNPYVQEPRMIKLPIVSQNECIWSEYSFAKFTSNRTFCAGLKDGSGPCNGDSGSGFVIHDPNTGRYHLRGVVSRSLLDDDTMSCDLTQYVIYVDVAKHLDWIRGEILKRRF